MKALPWDKVQQGDEETFRQFHEQYTDSLYGYGMKVAGGEILVTEMIQPLFVYILEKRETYMAPQFISAYLCASLRHMIMSESERENSGSLKSLDEIGTGERQFDLEINTKIAIIHSRLEKEQLEALQKELSNLTKQQQEVLYLKYYKETSPGETAQMVGLASRTVYNTTHTAISGLRERTNKSFPLLAATNL